MRIALLPIALGLALAPACSPSAAVDAGASPSSDVSSVDPGQCEAAVQSVIDVCGSARKCEHLEYKKLCRTGNPAVVTGVFQCFGRNMCWIPGDENTAGPCIDAAIRAIDPQADAFRAELCARCPDDGGGVSACGPLSSLTFAPWFLAPPDADPFRRCVANAMTCGDVTQCAMSALGAAAFVINPTSC